MEDVLIIDGVLKCINKNFLMTFTVKLSTQLYSITNAQAHFPTMLHNSFVVYKLSRKESVPSGP